MLDNITTTIEPEYDRRDLGRWATQQGLARTRRRLERQQHRLVIRAEQLMRRRTLGPKHAASRFRKIGELWLRHHDLGERLGAVAAMLEHT
jgi:hypothetical protein